MIGELLSRLGGTELHALPGWHAPTPRQIRAPSQASQLLCYSSRFSMGAWAELRPPAGRKQTRGAGSSSTSSRAAQAKATSADPALFKSTHPASVGEAQRSLDYSAKSRPTSGFSVQHGNAQRQKASGGAGQMLGSPSPPTPSQLSQPQQKPLQRYHRHQQQQWQQQLSQRIPEKQQTGNPVEPPKRGRPRGNPAVATAPLPVAAPPDGNGLVPRNGRPPQQQPVNGVAAVKPPAAASSPMGLPLVPQSRADTAVQAPPALTQPPLRDLLQVRSTFVLHAMLCHDSKRRACCSFVWRMRLRCHSLLSSRLVIPSRRDGWLRRRC